MKKRSSRGLIALVIALCLACITAMIPVGIANAEPAGETGSAEITVAPFAQDTVLAAFEVGYYLNGEFVLYDDFSDLDIDLTDIGEASKAQAAATIISAKAMEKEGAATAVIGEDGKAFFPVLDAQDKLFVIYQTNNENIVKISPMLVAMPYFDDNGDKITEVRLNAKYEDLRVFEKFGSIILTKQDPSGIPLEGAEFRFEIKTWITAEDVAPADAEIIREGEAEYYWRTVAETLTSDKNGQIVIKDLPFGVYRFIETKAPKGFELVTEPILVEIANEGAVRIADGIYVPDEGSTATVIVENTPEYFEPSIPSEPSEPSKPKPSEPTTDTGEDITKFIVIGAVVGVSLLVVIILLVVTKKKKK